MGDKEIGEYWQETVDGKLVWMIRARTGTFVRHCEVDAAASAQNAIKELVRWQRKQSMTFEQQVEHLMEDMLPYYENFDDIARDIAMWANDYAAWVMQQGRKDS